MNPQKFDPSSQRGLRACRTSCAHFVGVGAGVFLKIANGMPKFRTKTAVLALFIALACTTHTLSAYALEPDFNKLVDAIKLAENSKKFPYGIKSVKCSGEKECRKVCLNTVRNNYKRWLASDQKKTYLEFLRDRYAPLSDSPLNKNWLKNVNYFMEKI